MMVNHDDDQFREVLDELERVLLAPLVSGELASWTETALRAFHAAAPLLRDRVESVHPRELQEIFREDPELATEVDKMKQADLEILAGIDRLEQVLSKFFEVAPNVEPNEAPAADVLARVSEQGIDLIVSIRRQEEAMRVWHQESLLRDRGFGD
jgi:hypothetical protein